MKSETIKPLEAKTSNQRAYLAALENPLTTIATGFPGTGKTYMAAYKAIEGLLAKRHKKIVVCRPAIGDEDDLGFEPGEMDEKMAGWVKPVSEVFTRLLGKSQYLSRLGNTIELVPLHQVKGRSFDNCFIIVDEAQDMSVNTAISLVTRTGKYCKLVFCGDQRQQSLQRDSGLTFLIEKAEKHNLQVNMIDFGIDDCVRSKECKMWIEAFSRDGIF